MAVWIESHQALENHPKRIALSVALGWDKHRTIGALHCFWWWCVDYAEDGELRKYSDAMLGEVVGLTGEDARAFVAAMKAVGWLDVRPFRIHDWWDYIGRFLQVKYKTTPEKWKSVQNAYRVLPVDRGGCDNPPNTGCKAQDQPTTPNQPVALSRSTDPDPCESKVHDFLQRQNLFDDMRLGPEQRKIFYRAWRERGEQWLLKVVRAGEKAGVRNMAAYVNGALSNKDFREGRRKASAGNGRAIREDM